MVLQLHGNKALWMPFRFNQKETRGLNMQEASQSPNLQIGMQWSSRCGGLIGSRPKWAARRSQMEGEKGERDVNCLFAYFCPQWMSRVLWGNVILGNEPLLHWYFHIFLCSIHPCTEISILHSYHRHNHKNVIKLHRLLRPPHPLCTHTNTVNLKGKPSEFSASLVLLKEKASGILVFHQQENGTNNARVITDLNEIKGNYNKNFILISRTCYLIFSSWYRELTAGPPNPPDRFSPPLRSYK